MDRDAVSWKRLALLAMAAGVVGFTALRTGRALGFAPDAADFPAGFDAVTAAPGSHRVLFENDLVRVLEVTVPAPGTTEPMHHHHWPGFFLEWDTGGKTPHIRYHRPGGVRDIPSTSTPIHPGRWVVRWMKPEPMHGIETVENEVDPNAPNPVRVELKMAP